MKIKTWIKYEESYLPPRCRKLRYRACEEYVDINLREIATDALQLAFEDNSYQGKGKIFFFNRRLWCKAPRNMFIAERHGTMTALEELIWERANCGRYFRFSWDRQCGLDTSRDGVIKAARKDMRNYIVVNGELYVVTSEPRYVVNTFGLGCNHGGTGLFVEYHYNPNIRKDNYFSALDGKDAVAYANKIAAGRGDTNDVGKFKEMIVVHMPELVKINPRRQHGDGNKLMNDMESLISEVKDPFFAGLLCMSSMVSKSE